MRTRRTISRGMAIGMVAAVLTGCGGGATSEEDPVGGDTGTAAPATTLPTDTTSPAAGTCPDPSVEIPAVAAPSYDATPEMAIDAEAAYGALVETNCGVIELELFAADAPLAVNNFVTLARDGYFDGILFHRVIDGFMIQSGDPTGTGMGGPGYAFPDELDTVAIHGFEPGTLAMANAGADTNGSQFFIVSGDASHLRTHTVFGRVISGMEVVSEIASTPTGQGDRPVEDIAILSVEITEG